MCGVNLVQSYSDVGSKQKEIGGGGKLHFSGKCFEKYVIYSINSALLYSTIVLLSAGWVMVE